MIPYQNAQKSEFIRKGMLLYHSKTENIDKFPIDVAFAENRTNGNPNIIFRQEFDAKFIQHNAASIRSKVNHNVKI